ncbi:MAG: TolC family protein [Pseudomonadota bacterium]|uniref:TolC family protein n=1 Tax=Gallaecimonas pentaromativorans TaxID=584787 RepID=UPI00067E66D7|nr:TolC family protein [Gallaecimonas pentaromativorans]MED5523712.1 TolC family protein [Pseudomonadota bacterium]
MRIFVTMLFVLPLGMGGVIALAQPLPETLTLEEAVTLAIDADPWLTGSQYTQQALTEEATAAATLPDPRMSLMAGNFPVDTFDLNQEAMTQLSVGISQMFPRGDSLALAKRQKQQLAEQHPLLRLDRRFKVTTTVTQLWLEAFKAQESIRLIEQDRALFEQLVDAAEASYSSALGRARQQDVIRAQLELTRLEDRLTMLGQQRQVAAMRLSEWIGAPATAPLAPVLPTASLVRPLSVPTIEQASESVRYEWIRHHPALRALDQRIDATQTGIDLAKQKYKPEWGLSAQYGYRDSDPMGRDRADLFSVGVTFDLPIFTGNRQDKEVSAAINRTEAIKTEKHLLGRKLMAELETASVQLERLNERQALYVNQLLPQMAEQAEASLAAYNNDDGDFAEAVRARIAELNAKIDALAIAVERQKIIAQINYLLAEASSDDARPVE